MQNFRNRFCVAHSHVFVGNPLQTFAIRIYRSALQLALVLLKTGHYYMHIMCSVYQGGGGGLDLHLHYFPLHLKNTLLLKSGEHKSPRSGSPGE
jgi:hypothetical protein